MQWQELRSHIRHLPARDITKIGEAFELGKKMHAGQKRRSGEPYFNHPVAVTHILLTLNADTDTIIAALLHDTVEDTSLTISEIDHLFGGSVAKLIDGLTKLSSSDVAMSPKLDEQIETLRKIFTLMQQDVRIMVIKLVDRLHNMQTIEFLPPERQTMLAKETLEVFVKIADKLCMQDMRDELESLCCAVLEPETYGAILELRNTNEQRGLAMIEHIRESLRTQDRILSAKTDFVFERKTWNQIKAQLSAGSSVATGVSFISVAFVCDTIDACYRTLGSLHQLWKREVLSFQDFINEPQLNGYRGLHTTIIAHDGTRVRCKIRTKEMHQYARQGVTTVCFGGATEISEILPWTKRLSSLAKDTEGSSDDFWENLKNDILGESITIHGPDDSIVQMPRNSTALDAVFHLFHEQALHTKTIKVNGLEVQCKSPVPNGASLDISFSDNINVTHEWLDWSRTGLAAAEIHAWLASKPISWKIQEGQHVLREIMKEKKKGLLEEFDIRSMSASLEKRGLPPLNDLLVAMAEGRRKPQDVYETIFEKTNSKIISEKDPKEFTLRFTMPKNKPEHLRELVNVTQKFMMAWQSIRMREMEGDMIRFTMMVKATRRKMAIFEQDLIDAGATKIEWFARTQREFFLMTTVILLWALNPVLVTWFLQHGFSPMALMTVRFLTVGGFMSLFFIVWRSFVPKKFTPIPHITILTLPSTLANAAMMVYLFALQTVPPSVHLMILRFNTLLLPILERKNSSKPHNAIVIFCVVLILTVSGIIALLGNAIVMGLVLSCSTLIFYTIYSISTERTLQQHNIDIRYPYFLFHSGLISGVIGLILLPWQSMSVLLSPLTLLAVMYVVLCACVTQLCYAALLKTVSFKYFTDLFLVEVPLAMMFEYVLLGISLPLPLYVIMAAAVTAILFLRWKAVY